MGLSKSSGAGASADTESDAQISLSSSSALLSNINPDSSSTCTEVIPFEGAGITLTTAHPSSPISLQKPHKLSRGALFRLTVALLGIQFCWSVQVGYITKILLQLGLSKRYVSYAWLAGPIGGIVMQPIAGALSDNCRSRFGRRRPFLVIGAAIAIVCLLLVSNARAIGVALGDSPARNRHHVGLAIAITSFWALDFAINAAQGPLRTLLADVAPPAQHKQGNAYFALMTGLGNLSGALCGSVPLSRYATVFSTDVSALYALAALVLAVCVGVTAVSVKEVPLTNGRLSRTYSLATDNDDHDDDDRGMDVDDGDMEMEMDTGVIHNGSIGRSSGNNSARSRTGGLKAFLEAGVHAPSPFWELFTVQCFTWFAWFTIFVFGTSWVGSAVYNGVYNARMGSNSRNLYDMGVRAGNFGIGVQSAVTIIFSFALPKVLKTINAPTVYISAHVLLAGALLSTPFINKRSEQILAIIALAITGVPWAVTMTIPWALMGETVAKEKPLQAGVYYSIFNLSQCVPEIVVSVLAERIIMFAGSQAAVLAAGGFAAALGALMIVVLRIGEKSTHATVV